jgi:endonuclease/exonuclease/phosphatase family metal-dependent hydrolase
VHLRAVTYNIHKARGLDGRVRLDRIARVLSELDADIIALQEVVRIQSAAAQDDQAAWLHAELRGFHLAFGENRMHRGGAYGNAILSRFKIVESENYDLTWRGRERRGCLRADVRLSREQVLHVFNVHLGTAFLERRHQGRVLTSSAVLGREVKGPRIVLGDFNEWTRGLTTKLLTIHFEALRPKMLLGRARSYPGVLPVLHLDHIYYDRAVTLSQMSLHRSRTALIASDHLPLLADFEIQ